MLEGLAAWILKTYIGKFVNVDTERFDSSSVSFFDGFLNNFGSGGGFFGSHFNFI
jgi:hypothetical protein